MVFLRRRQEESDHPASRSDDCSTANAKDSSARRGKERPAVMADERTYGRGKVVGTNPALLQCVKNRQIRAGVWDDTDQRRR